MSLDAFAHDFLNVARFYYRHGTTSRLTANLKQIHEFQRLLSESEQGEFHFLSAISLLRQGSREDAIRELHEIRKRFMPKYVNNLINYLSLRVPLTDDQVRDTEFQLRRSSGHIVAQIRLEDDNSISGIDHPNEKNWDILDGDLYFFGFRGEATSIFVSHESSANLVGPFLMHPIMHELQAVQHA